jgi:ABC-type dipeptide/oligopeptide/nickel transport system permease subunit
MHMCYATYVHFRNDELLGAPNWDIGIQSILRELAPFYFVYTIVSYLQVSLTLSASS